MYSIVLSPQSALTGMIVDADACSNSKEVHWPTAWCF